MKKIVLFDTSVGTMNQGDNIIMQSVMNNTEEIRNGNFTIHFPTHTPCFTSYQQFKQNPRYDFVRHADLKFICGTNIITKGMLFPWPFWNVNLFNSTCYKDAICMGVGSGGFSEQNNMGGGGMQKFSIRRFYQKNMSIVQETSIQSICLKALV